MSKQKTIIFSYQLLSNIGCEIIVRGTMAFLTRAFPDYDLRFVISSYHVERDREILSDVPNVHIVPMLGWKRIARGFLAKTGLNRYIWTPRFGSEHFRKADLFVSVGGDIYTMFGNKPPEDWIGYEMYATKHKIPAIMFGANMERFEVLSDADRRRLLVHLARFQLIAVRDAGTKYYLEKFGISQNVEVFPDPIFSLRPNTNLSHQSIKTVGLNVSPYVLKEFGPQGMQRLADVALAIVQAGYHLHLIPHVYASDKNPSIDDRVAIQKLLSLLPEAVYKQVSTYDGSMSFGDMGREIGQVDLFIGLRMHACLNAITLGKPVFFLGYSRKAATMVEWLRSQSPFQVEAGSIDTAMTDAVTPEIILSFIARQQAIVAERAAPSVKPIIVETQAALDRMPIWSRIAAILPAVAKRKTGA